MYVLACVLKCAALCNIYLRFSIFNLRIVLNLELTLYFPGNISGNIPSVLFIYSVPAAFLITFSLSVRSTTEVLVKIRYLY